MKSELLKKIESQSYKDRMNTEGNWKVQTNGFISGYFESYKEALLFAKLSYRDGNYGCGQFEIFTWDGGEWVSEPLDKQLSENISYHAVENPKMTKLN